MRKIYGYARVSTKEQHLDRQITALLDCGVEERDIVTDKASGASLERPGYQALKHTMLREGDTLVFKSLDRLSRNKEHISQELRYFKEHQVPQFLPTAFFFLCVTSIILRNPASPASCMEKSMIISPMASNRL